MFSFYKMQATGNDFIIINFLEKKLEYSFKLLSKFLCDRHFGVGGDGVLILETSEIADFKMRIFNKDGSEAEMCGNGIRCLSKYIYESQLTDKLEFKIETIAGVKNIKLYIEGNTVEEIEVDMGRAKFNLEDIPVIYLENNYQGKLNIEKLEIYPVSIGNPHAVCFVEDVSKIDIKGLGEFIENYKYFPNKTNVEFVQIIDKKNIKVRIWERGVGETLSCGTGACAAAVISNKYKDTNSKLTVNLLGGKLTVFCDENIKLKGSAENVFSGNILK